MDHTNLYVAFLPVDVLDYLESAKNFIAALRHHGWMAHPSLLRCFGFAHAHLLGLCTVIPPGKFGEFDLAALKPMKIYNPIALVRLQLVLVGGHLLKFLIELALSSPPQDSALASRPEKRHECATLLLSPRSFSTRSHSLDGELQRRRHRKHYCCPATASWICLLSL